MSMQPQQDLSGQPLRGLTVDTHRCPNNTSTEGQQLMDLSGQPLLDLSGQPLLDLSGQPLSLNT